MPVVAIEASADQDRLQSIDSPGFSMAVWDAAQADASESHTHFIQKGLYLERRVP